MFTVIKRMEISQLPGGWYFRIAVNAPVYTVTTGLSLSIAVPHGSTPKGMVVDFTRIKEVVTEKLDHQNLNEVLPFNPTAENIARWVCRQIPQCYKVEVQESKETSSSTRKMLWQTRKLRQQERQNRQ